MTVMSRPTLLWILLFPIISIVGHPKDCAKLNVNATLNIDFGRSGKTVNIRMIRVIRVQTIAMVTRLNALLLFV